jgi:chorismate mutase
MQRGGTGWLGRLALGARPVATARAPLLASRDLPPPPRDPETRLALPRSPDPLPEEALRFARHADMRAIAPQSPPMAGNTLRDMLECVEERLSLRDAIAQAKEAQRRLAERLQGEDQVRIGRQAEAPPGQAPARDAEAALAEALAVLRLLSSR